jgi:hypothetical protein
MSTKTSPKPVQAHSEPVEQHPIDVLARAVLKVLVAGNGRSNRCEVNQELPQRLATDNVNYDPAQLQLALVRLEDSGCIQRVQRQPYSSYPQYIVLNGMSRYDDIDRLAADVAAAVRSRGDEFEDERQLCSWLEEDQVQYDERSLIAAIRQLENLGRIKRPWQDHDQWISDRSLPGYWVPPKIFNER